MSNSPAPVSPLEADARAVAARLARGFAALVVLTTALIVLGAMVRAHGAGLACPDWPLCFGQVVPEFDLKVAFEWGHRAVAGSVSLVFLGLGVLVLRQAALRRVALPWLGASALLLAVQIVLGALTVWELLASWTVTSHLLTGNAVNASFLLAGWRLYEASQPGFARARVSTGVRALVLATAGVLFVQLVLGGLVSSKFAALACDEWPACHGGEWFPGFEGARGIHLLHRIGAYTLVVALAASAVATRGLPRIGTLLAAAATTGLAQAGVGVANVLLRVPVEVTGLHSLLAAVLVLLVALAVREVCAGGRIAGPAPDA